MPVVSSVLEWLETHPAVEGIPVHLETLPADGSAALSLQTLAAEKIVRRYKDGGYIARYEFAVRVRVLGTDTAARLGAIGVLGDIASSVDAESTWPTPPDGTSWVSLEVQMVPVRVAVDADGSEDYQVSFELTYRKE